MVQFVWILVFLAVSGVNSEASQSDGDIDIAKHRYMASIRMNGKHECSGVILNKNAIVTSNRCVPPFEHSWNIMRDHTIVTGTSTIKPEDKRLLIKETFSQNHYIDPTKNPVTSGIGVVKTVKPIQFGDQSQPIELSSTKVLPGAKLLMIGWTIKNSEGEITSNLKEVTLRVIDHQECQPFHKKSLTNDEFCTLPESPGDFCGGDSGSALIYEGKLVGLTTYGISCEDPLIPDVITQISNQHGYLEKVLDA